MRFPVRSTLTAVLVLAQPGTAGASHIAPPTVIHHVLGDGYGMLAASPAGHDVLWERCPADQTACVPHDDGDGNPRSLHVGDPPPGTTFQATQDAITVRSEPWRGWLHAVEPPRVEGDIRVGGRVRPFAGMWEGGWGREKDWMQLQACRTPQGTECKVVLDTIQQAACLRGSDSRLLPARYEGWWLRVLDARIDQVQPFAAVLHFTPETIRPLEPAPGVSIAVAGQIAPGSPPAADCVAPGVANAVLRPVIRRAERGRLVALTATCSARCRLHLIVRQGGRSLTVRRTLSSGTTHVALPRAAARRQLRSGRVTVHVHVDGVQVARGRALLRVG